MFRTAAPCSVWLSSKTKNLLTILSTLFKNACNRFKLSISNADTSSARQDSGCLGSQFGTRVRLYSQPGEQILLRCYWHGISRFEFHKFLLSKSNQNVFFQLGVVAKPLGKFYSADSYQYQLLNCNVNLLKIIQIGLTFMDEEGNPAPGCSSWQFNFKFRISWVV